MPYLLGLAAAAALDLFLDLFVVDRTARSANRKHLETNFSGPFANLDVRPFLSFAGRRYEPVEAEIDSGISVSDRFCEPARRSKLLSRL